MRPSMEFHEHGVYKAVAELTDLIYGLEDRFPEDELAVLFQRLRAAAVDVGAAIAAGVGRDGLDDHGSLSLQTMRDTRAKLSELRHYVLVSQARFFLDEHHVEAFQQHYERIASGLTPGESGSP